MLDTPLALGVVCAITLLSRCVFRIFICSRVRSSDTLHHLKCMLLVKDVGWREAVRRRPDSPMGYHRLISFLPGRLLSSWEIVNGGVFDSLHILLFVFVLESFGGRSLPPAIVWFWAPLLLAFYPGWTHVGAGPRSYYATERVFAELLISVVFSSLWLSSIAGASWWLWYVVATLVAGGMLNTSKFGAQVLVGFSIIIAILSRSWRAAALPILAVSAALVISRGSYWTILRRQWQHLRWYAALSDCWAARRNSRRMLLDLVSQKGWFRGLVAYCLVHNSWSVGILGNVPIGVALVLAAMNVGSLPSAGYAWYWFIAATALWAVTSLRPFRFLGEAERYLVHGAVPCYFLIAHWLATAPPYARWLLLLYSLLWFGSQQVVLWTLSREDEPSPTAVMNQRELIEFLRGLSPRRVLTFGSAWFHWYIAYRTHPQPHWLFDPRVNTTVTWKELFSVYPYPTWEVVRLLDVELIAVEKTELPYAKQQFPFASLHKILENEHYAVYDVTLSAVI